MNRLLKILMVGAVVLLVPIVPFLIIGELPGARWLSASDGNAWLFTMTGGGLLALDVLLPIPSSVLIALMGGRLGFYAGWASAWLGLTAGTLLGYSVGRLWPQKWVPEISESPTLVLLFLSRPVPILAEAMTIAAGATRIPFMHMLAACAVGNVIYAGILAADGAALLAADWTGPGIILPLLVPVIGWGLWRWAGKRAATSQRG
jgi:uncharacterized membrane protein YdjX (TVP38/TMEM64 family)